MPNWAIGSVSINGTKEGIIHFASRFLYDDQEGKPTGKYFARSFTDMTYQQTLDEITALFAEVPQDAQAKFSMGISFAWSAHRCIISGYPQMIPDDCITLADACIADNVSVEIWTEECSSDFEEHIFCTGEGVYVEERNELLSYTCPNCGHIEHAASFADPDDILCGNCGKMCCRSSTDASLS